MLRILFKWHTLLIPENDGNHKNRAVHICITFGTRMWLGSREGKSQIALKFCTFEMIFVRFKENNLSVSKKFHMNDRRRNSPESKNTRNDLRNTNKQHQQ